MAQIAFLKVSDLKEKTIIQSNVDEKILGQSITEFQDLEVEPLLGKENYKRFSNEFLSAATIASYQLSTSDSELFSYLKPYMIYGVLLNSLDPLHYKITNKGVQKLTDANAVAGDKSDIEAIKSSYTLKMDAYRKRLVEYLAHDEDKTNDVACEIAIDSTFNFTGMYLGDNDFDYQESYKASAYKTGYYRRRL